MLAISFDEEQREWLRKDYSATCMGMIGKLLGGENWALGNYIEMAYQDRSVIDTRTPDEIKADIVRRLTA